MRIWSVSVTTWLVWLALAIGVVAIAHMASTAHAQQTAEVVQPGPLLVDIPSDDADTAMSLSDPTAETELVPIAEPEDGMTIEMYGGVGPCGCESSYGTSFWAQWLHSTCDMPQHHAYFPPLHGYYYFRPYHPGHLTRQQRFVTGWGGDARHPYANHVFEAVYAEYETERRASMSSQAYRLPPAPSVSGTRK